MVQRKFTDKLGIQVDSKDHTKSERKAKAIKPSSSQHTDIRNKGGGTELTKKMKKSRTFKLSDSEILGSNPVKRGKSRLNTTSIDVAIADATPEKKPNLIKVSDNSPNYMKSTNSSNAKTERSPVTPYGSTKTSCESTSPNWRNSNFQKPCGSGSDHKQVKSLTKTSSLKPVKTLTKTYSMKVVKKSSEIALKQQTQNVTRATCSSTLKNSKFPEFVTLYSHPSEGTESEGTSVMKVCPYTYCSLNGHCHSPLPPLNRFLSARRRLLRNQKSMRLKGQLSPPVRTKISGNRTREIDTGQIDFSGDPAMFEADMDFFVEIYAQPRKDTSKPNGNDEAETNLAMFSEVLGDNNSNLVKDGAKTEPENDCGSRGGSLLLDESSDFEFEDHLSQNCCVAETDISIMLPGQNKVKVEDSNYECCFIQEETYLDHGYESELERGISGESELDESISAATDMDWEERREDPGLQDKQIFKPDDIFSNYCRYVPANGDEFQSEYEENIEKINAEFDDSDYDDRDQISEIDLCLDISNIISFLPENGFLEIQSLASCQVFHEIQQDSHKKACAEGSQAHTEIEVCQFNSLIEVETRGEIADGYLLLQTDETQSNDEYSELQDMVENKDQCKSREVSISSSINSEKHNDSEGMNKLKSAEEITGSDEKMQVEDNSGIDIAAESWPKANNHAGREEEQPMIINAGFDSQQQTSKSCSNLNKPIKIKGIVEDGEEPRAFNPREPQYLPVELDPEKEKVDLRHQMMDERKNAEEWMLDYALRQAVTKLAPAHQKKKKKKVALLVEAFETIKPLPK